MSQFEETSCEYCGRQFDANEEGHIDCATDLAFCSPECEDHYDQETGLPKTYERAYLA